MSSIQQIQYGTTDIKALWLCYFYMLRKGRYFLYALGIGVLFFSALVAMSLPITFFEVAMFASIVLFVPLFLRTAVVTWLVLTRRICTTTITEFGITDQISGFKPVEIPWSAIRNIDFNNGNVYFFTARSGAFVPNYAFPAGHAALEFYRHAEQLRNDIKVIGAKALTVPNEADPSVVSDSLAQIREFDAQEEAMWKQLEETHQKEQDTN
jgi:hypothetical protein